ncbi:cell surface protein [Lachnospiraceae bacterium TWA4]|nr:cell surface protein [Lachnospiraceae bacterium TWA4]
MKKLEASVFSNCGSLISIDLPSGIESIEAFTFDCCYSLESVVLPEKLTKIGYFSFNSCISLTNIEIPNSVQSIDEGAFERCYNLRTIKFPTQMTTIGERAFVYCKSLKNVKLPSGITRISSCLFAGCNRLETVSIPEGVTTIEEEAFYNCKRLKELTIPNSVKQIEDSVFENCNNLMIYVYLTSYAQTYAKENKIPFKLVGEGEHQYRTTIIKADATKKLNGSIKDICHYCGSENVKEIYAPLEIVVSNEFAYTGAKIEPMIKVRDSKLDIIDNSNYKVSYSNNIKIGKATVKVTFKGDKYTGSLTKTFKIVKAKPVIKVKTTAKTFKVSDLKKKVKTFSIGASSEGKLTYQVTKKNKNLSINSKGVVTVKKGTKKGTYSMTVKISSKATSNYVAGSKSVTIKVVVK